MKLSELLDIHQLRHDIEDGYVKVSVHDDDPYLMIFNYTHKCQNDSHWNDVTRQTRGLIAKSTTGSLDGEIVTKPFGKFFNLGEHPEGTYGLDENVIAVDKMDGSLGILYPHPKGGYAIATRGSFHSEQAVKGTEMLQDAISQGFTPKDGFTYLFEILYPENRIVLDYKGFEGLVVLRAAPPDRSEAWWIDEDAEDFFGTPVDYFGNLVDVLEDLHRDNKEGYVVHFIDREGPMWETAVKVKQEDYIALHRIVTGLNELTVWELMGKYPTYSDALVHLNFPEEFRRWFTNVWMDLRGQQAAIEGGVWDEWDQVSDEVFGDWAPGIDVTREERKVFADAVSKSGNRSLLFLVLDRKWDQLDKALWRMTRPTQTNNRVQEKEAA